MEINAVQPTPEQVKEFLAAPDDGPIVMVNLLKFKPDGGREEYAKYSEAMVDILKNVGAKVLFSGAAEFCFVGHGDWDAVALVEYPRRKSLMDMARSEVYQAIHHHREAGLEGQINYAVVQNKGLNQ